MNGKGLERPGTVRAPGGRIVGLFGTVRPHATLLIMIERAVPFICFSNPAALILVELERVLLFNFWFGKAAGTYCSSLDLSVWVQFQAYQQRPPLRVV